GTVRHALALRVRAHPRDRHPRGARRAARGPAPDRPAALPAADRARGVDRTAICRTLRVRPHEHAGGRRVRAARGGGGPRSRDGDRGARRAHLLPGADPPDPRDPGERDDARGQLIASGSVKPSSPAGVRTTMTTLLPPRVSRYPAGLRSARHAHPYTNLSVILAGSLRERVGRDEVTVGPLRVVVKPADTEHANRFGPEGATLLRVELPTTL